MCFFLMKNNKSSPSMQCSAWNRKWRTNKSVQYEDPWRTTNPESIKDRTFWITKYLFFYRLPLSARLKKNYKVPGSKKAISIIKSLLIRCGKIWGILSQKLYFLCRIKEWWSKSGDPSSILNMISLFDSTSAS